MEIEWKNYGHTPARSVLAHLNVEAFSNQATPEQLAFVDVQNYQRHRQTLGPQQIYFCRNYIPIQKILRSWRNEAEVIYWAWIEYDGLDEGKRHRTEICAILTAQNDPTSLNAGFRNTWVTRFNAADKDCIYQPKTATGEVDKST